MRVILREEYEYKGTESTSRFYVFPAQCGRSGGEIANIEAGFLKETRLFNDLLRRS
ncbi:MAG: hypothetical protein WA996_04675 [Candidatus Promineifilaceae bacterium]